MAIVGVRAVKEKARNGARVIVLARRGGAARWESFYGKDSKPKAPAVYIERFAAFEALFCPNLACTDPPHSWMLVYRRSWMTLWLRKMYYAVCHHCDAKVPIVEDEAEAKIALYGPPPPPRQ